MVSLSKKEIKRVEQVKEGKHSPKVSSTHSKLSKIAARPIPDQDGVDGSDDEDENIDEAELYGSEEGDVSEDGMKRLMELVGEEDLNDFERAQLALDEEDIEDDDEDDDGEEGDEDIQNDGIENGVDDEQDDDGDQSSDGEADEAEEDDEGNEEDEDEEDGNEDVEDMDKVRVCKEVEQIFC